MTEKLVPPFVVQGQEASAGRELARLAKHMVKVRRALAGLYPEELFRNSAWDLMLELFVARGEGRALCIKDLLAISRESATSALRGIDRLQSAGLLSRRLDPRDHRRMQADLTDRGYTAVVLMLEQLFDLGGEGALPAVPPRSFVPHRRV